MHTQCMRLSFSRLRVFVLMQTTDTENKVMPYSYFAFTFVCGA